MADIEMEDVTMSKNKITGSAPNTGRASSKNAAAATAPSKNEEHIRVYLRNHRASIWATIKTLNKEIKGMAKEEQFSVVVGLKLSKVEAYHKLDDDMELEQAKSKQAPKLANDAPRCKAIKSKVESREAEISGWSVDGDENAELDDAGKEKVVKYLAERAAKKSAVRRAQRARQSARKAEKKALEEMTKKAKELTVAEKPDEAKNAVTAVETGDKQAERTPMKRKRVEVDEDVMEADGGDEMRLAKKSMVFRLRSGDV